LKFFFAKDRFLRYSKKFEILVNFFFLTSALHTADFATAASQNGSSICRLSLHKETNFITKMTKAQYPFLYNFYQLRKKVNQTPFCDAAVAKYTVMYQHPS
jgi:hypothetical protein